MNESACPAIIVAVSPIQLRPLPKAPPRKESTKGQKRGRTAIVTDSPVKHALEEQAEERDRGARLHIVPSMQHIARLHIVLSMQHITRLHIVPSMQKIARLHIVPSMQHIARLHIVPSMQHIARLQIVP
ncbi:tigger transposable element-derived protein 6 [Plakobranchus ocellatus]|uniref:Tigger transposable element-derived protein 6 n=1 Tax=Plakobranchus ocellatus TaxID=259542 RepID=A0AAV4A2E3_9GAST|nr:tigger transposable element-derived protein 6 [Plakobranchus ocellatus]